VPPDPPPADPPAPPDPPPADPPAPPDPPPADPPAPSTTLEGDALKEELAKTRREAAKYRTERKAERERAEALEKQLAGISKAIGVDDPEPDPEKLTAQYEQAMAKFRKERTSNAVVTAAADQGANIEMMRYYLTGSGALEDLDIEAEDFAVQVADKVKSAIESHPELKAGQLGPGSGDQGPRGGASQLTRDDLKDMEPEQIEKARQDGRLDTLMGRNT